MTPMTPARASAFPNPATHGPRRGTHRNRRGTPPVGAPAAGTPAASVLAAGVPAGSVLAAAGEPAASVLAGSGVSGGGGAEARAFGLAPRGGSWNRIFSRIPTACRLRQARPAGRVPLRAAR